MFEWNDMNITGSNAVNVMNEVMDEANEVRDVSEAS